MTLPTQTPQEFINSMASAFAAQTGIPPVFTSGDVLLALFQTWAIQADFVQALVLVVNNLTRAQTSTGADLDLWMAQFGFTRLPATFATGIETFSASSPVVTPINIVAGTIVQTTDGGIQYQVVADADNPTWNASLNAYVLAIGETSLTGTVRALVAGSAQNVSANMLVVVGTPLPGISSVTNGSAIDNGLDAESDDAFRARFVQYLASLAKATRSAIVAAINSVQQGLTFALFENQQPDGSPLRGCFTVFVDDGSGDPPTELLNAIGNALNEVRAFGVQAFVEPPIIETATIVMAIRVASGYDVGDTQAAVKAAVSHATNILSFGDTLFISSIAEAALTVAGVTAVQPGTTINAVAADFVPASTHLVRTSTADITVSTY